MANDWFIRINEVEHGPLTSERLKLLARQGKVAPETFIKQGASGAWHRASHVTGLFPMAASRGTPATAAPLPKPSSPPTIPAAKAGSVVPPQPQNAANALPPPLESPPVGEKKDNLVRNVGIAAGATTLLFIALLIVPDMMRDKWELNNTDRVIATLKQADALQKSDPFAAYKIYDDVLKEAKPHKITALLSDELAGAEKARTALYAKVEDKIRAEEAEKKRVANEKAKRAAEEKQRIAEEQEQKQRAEAERKLAEEKAEKRKQELKEMAAKYRNASPQARAALNALKKIEARTEIGVSYANYSQVLGEQYGEIKIFLESPEGQQMPLFSSSIADAIKQYKDAMEGWKTRIELRMDPGERIQIPWSEASKAIKKAEDVLLNPEKYLEESR